MTQWISFTMRGPAWVQAVKKEILGISLSTYCYTTWVSATSLSSWLERRQGLCGLSSLGFTFLPGVEFFLPGHTLTLILSPIVSLRTTEVGKETCWNLWRFRPDCLGRKLSILQARYSLFGMNLTIFCCDLLMILCNYVLCKLHQVTFLRKLSSLFILVWSQF